MAAEWTYSDWETSYTDGSSAQLARLKLHIKEVADRISTGNFAVEGKSHDVGPITEYLKTLQERRDEIAAAIGSSTGTRSAFTRARLV